MLKAVNCVRARRCYRFVRRYSGRYSCAEVPVYTSRWQ